MIRGDNLGALSDALKLSSTATAMNTIGREIAWRKVVRGWQYCLSHLPAEQNDEADALSRLEAEPRREMPLLGDATFVAPPEQDDKLWRARLDFSHAGITPAVTTRVRGLAYKRSRLGRRAAWPM